MVPELRVKARAWPPIRAWGWKLEDAEGRVTRTRRTRRRRTDISTKGVADKGSAERKKELLWALNIRRRPWKRVLMTTS